MRGKPFSALTDIEISERLSWFHCKFISKERKSNQTYIRYIAQCGHEHEERLDSFNSRKYKLCPKCSKELACRDRAVLKFKTMCREADVEYVDTIKLDNRFAMKYVAKCGHENLCIPRYFRPEVCCECNTDYGCYNLSVAERDKEVLKELPGILYVLEVSGNGERFYKIGITKRRLLNRMWEISKRVNPLGYEYSVIKTIEGNLYDTIRLEKELHDKYKEFQYFPKFSFDGKTECFSQVEGVA